ncbi:hypothetical protein [Vannielia sp.]|uniref:hypothetical protein n=1 Tax=Vannielia sp. TaxID=2813045 RepID=UPI0026326862|nr:hypothetical protein [Vannielia sp.]MDF1874104.1 hypothetical protein [Vannielia sp.]
MESQKDLRGQNVLINLKRDPQRLLILRGSARLRVALQRGRLEVVLVGARGVSTGLLKVDAGLKGLESLGDKGLVISRGLVINLTVLLGVGGQLMLALVRGAPMTGGPVKKGVQREQIAQLLAVLRASELLETGLAEAARKGGEVMRGHVRARENPPVAGVNQVVVSPRLAVSLRLGGGLVVLVVRGGKKVGHGVPHARSLLAKFILHYI